MALDFPFQHNQKMRLGRRETAKVAKRPVPDALSGYRLSAARTRRSSFMIYLACHCVKVTEAEKSGKDENAVIANEGSFRGMDRKISGLDFVLLILLASFWGSAFLFIKIAITSIPPMSLAAGRVAIGAMILYGMIRLYGLSLPGDIRSWLGAAGVTMAGTVVPFFLIGWGQQSVDSALTAICMASVPLFTLPLAHLMTHDEKLHITKVVGVIIGFSGVAVLVISSTSGMVSATPQGLTAILSAAFGYALSGLLIHRLTYSHPFVMSTMILISGAVILIVLSVVLDNPLTLSPDRDAWLSLLVLGIFPTGFATLLVVHLVRRVGPTFMSLNNYLVPVVGIICGVVWLDETLGLWSIFAFLLIFCGIFLTMRKSAPATAPDDSRP